VQFPCRYLGIQLSVYALKKAAFQPLVDAVANRLTLWKARLMPHAGHTALTKSTLSTMPVHVIIVVQVAPGIIKEINRVMRSFIWTGTHLASGGQCRVAWSAVTSPVELGGLGVVDLTTLGYTLCLQWVWLACTDPERMSSMPIAGASKSEQIGMAMFDASTSV
jgi:hypothetical protein